LVRYFGIAALSFAIVFALVLAPISTCSQHIYIITVLTLTILFAFYFTLLGTLLLLLKYLTSFLLIFVSFCCIKSVRWLIHFSVRVLSLNRYHLWILPNLNEDVGLVDSFCPIYLMDCKKASEKLVDDLNQSQLTNVPPIEQVQSINSVFEDVPLDDSSDEQSTASDRIDSSGIPDDQLSSSLHSLHSIKSDRQNNELFKPLLSENIQTRSLYATLDPPTTNLSELRKRRSIQDDDRLGFSTIGSNVPATIDALNLGTDTRPTMVKSLVSPANVFRECKQLIQKTMDKGRPSMDKRRLDSSGDDFEILNEADILNEIRN
jgi:hypothetical protein